MKGNMETYHIFLGCIPGHLVLGNGHGEVHWSPSACPQYWLSSFWRTRDVDVGT